MWPLFLYGCGTSFPTQRKGELLKIYKKKITKTMSPEITNLNHLRAEELHDS
jgi:hypothetical protein